MRTNIHNQLSAKLKALCARHTGQKITTAIIMLAVTTIFCAAQPALAQPYPRLIFEPALLSPLPETSSGEVSTADLDSAQQFLADNKQDNELTDLLGPQDQPLTEAQLARFEQAVETEETVAGAYGADLTESLLDLGNAYRQNGQFEQALEAYDRAFHVSRIHNGLFSEKQEPVIQAISATYLAMGEVVQAHEQKEYLYYLKQKINQDNPQGLIQASLEFADWNYSLAEYIYHLKQADSYEFLLMRFLDAKTHYNRAADALQESTSATDPVLDPIIVQSVRSNYYVARFMSMLTNTLLSSRGVITTYHLSESFQNSPYIRELSDAGYRAGEEALQRRLAMLRNRNSEPQQIAATLSDLGDWNLLFQRRSTARDFYLEAMTITDEMDSSPTPASGLPQPIPSFIPAENSREAYQIADATTLTQLGYIDTSFVISRYGDTLRLEILGTSPEMTEEIIQHLARTIDTTRYRPHINEEGKLVDHTVSLRFNVLITSR